MWTTCVSTNWDTKNRIFTYFSNFLKGCTCKLWTEFLCMMKSSPFNYNGKTWFYYMKPHFKFRIHFFLTFLLIFYYIYLFIWHGVGKDGTQLVVRGHFEVSYLVTPFVSYARKQVNNHSCRHLHWSKPNQFF